MESFKRLNREIPLLKGYIQPTCEFVLVKTQSDNLTKTRVVSSNDIEQFQKEHQSDTSDVHYQKTSAKTGKGIKELHTILDNTFQKLYPNNNSLQTSLEYEPQQHATNYAFQFNVLTKIVVLGGVALGIAALITINIAKRNATPYLN